MILPLVSVLMTAYNREAFIGDAIESVLASTYSNFELIIVDDCSSDNTVTIARTYQAIDGRISVFVNEQNLKQFQNRNKAASLAKGEFIFYVDSDDTVFVDGLERLVETMNRFPDSSFGMYWYEPTVSKAIEIDSKTAIYNHFFKEPMLLVGPGGTILKRTFFLKIGGYTDKYDAAGDMYFNLKACCYSSIVRIPFEFMTYRRHVGQELNNPFEYLYNNYRYLRDALVELPLPLKTSELNWLRKKNSRRFLINIIRYFVKTKDVFRTKEALQKSGFKFQDAMEGMFH